MKTVKVETTPKNFRLSPAAILILDKVSKARNLNDTKVVEYCLARYGHMLCLDTEACELLLKQIICEGASQRLLMAAKDASANVSNEVDKHRDSKFRNEVKERLLAESASAKPRSKRTGSA